MGSPSAPSTSPSTSGTSTIGWRRPRCPYSRAGGGTEAGTGAGGGTQKALHSQDPTSPEQRLHGPQALACFCPQDSSCVSMPAYFRFLTLMAFHVFLQEKVCAHSLEPCV